MDETMEALYRERDYFWIGVYQVEDEAVIRQTYRGPAHPCHSFHFREGNVGTTGQDGIVKYIPDVTEDDNYKMCFIETKSEIVIPIRLRDRVVGVIDV